MATDSRSNVGGQGPAAPFSGRVLLVDDMHDDANLLALLLAPLGASVVVAGSAREAIGILDQQGVDLVVTDLNMPDSTGLDLAREVRGRLDVPAVIFLTGSQRAGDRVEAFELGAVAYLQKPVDVKHLLGLAKEILRARRAARTREGPANDTDPPPSVH